MEWHSLRDRVYKFVSQLVAGIVISYYDSSRKTRNTKKRASCVMRHASCVMRAESIVRCVPYHMRKT